ncbi:MAG TPA: MFS transporter [Legionella sp.]|nr:MFS transporter [Legionella sp.]
MKQPWLSRVFPIAAIYSFRMLGLFMLIPVFSVCATELKHATPELIGMALGSYGLSQGLLQIPFGMLSDRVGRKPMITLGLMLFACGSLLGAYTDSIYGMIFARILQGTGAIGSVLMALLTDLTPDSARTKAMAVIGVTIGLSFSLAMIISPAMTHYFGLHGIFYFTTLLAVFGLVLLHTAIPTPIKEPFQIPHDLLVHQFKQSLQNLHLQRLNAGIFFQHLMLTSTFFAIPMILQQHVKLGHLTEQWHFYLPLMIGSFLAMLPFIILAERKQQMKAVFIGSVIVMGLSQFILAYNYSNWLLICTMMFVYFIAFNILEANLPSLVSRFAPSSSKGTAMGIYSSSQFLGIFAGGALSGVIYQSAGFQGIFIINGCISLVWLGMSLYMQPNQYQLTLVIPYAGTTHEKLGLMQALRTLPGVQEAVYDSTERCIYLRVNKATYQNGSAEKILYPR